MHCTKLVERMHEMHKTINFIYTIFKLYSFPNFYNPYTKKKEVNKYKWSTFELKIQLIKTYVHIRISK